MATKAEVTLQLERIEKAYATGTLKVKHGDTETTFRSLDEMERIIRYLKGILDNWGTKTTRRIRYIRQETKG